MVSPETTKTATSEQKLYLDADQNSSSWYIRVSASEMIDALDRFSALYPKLCSFIGYDEEFSYFEVSKSALAVTLIPPIPEKISLVSPDHNL